jgi:hypothetical protein
MHRTFLTVDCIVAYTTLLTDLSRSTAPSFENNCSDTLSSQAELTNAHISKVLSIWAEQPTQLTFPEFHAIFELMAVHAGM